ncbi:MAG: hypothetical protein R3F13_07075 [Prosthecobacter sp.]
MLSRLSALVLLLVTTAAFSQEIRRTPLTLKDGGTPEKPAVFDGKGMVIDLGIDVTAHEWEKKGDVWTSHGPFADHPPVADTQRAALFIEEAPIRIVRDRAAEQKSGEKGKVIYAAAETLKPGEMGFKDDGSIYFRWPAGKTPGAAKIYRLPDWRAVSASPAPTSQCATSPPCITAANDGFNIHGARLGIRLENVKAFSMVTRASAPTKRCRWMSWFEIAWNGSVPVAWPM